MNRSIEWKLLPVAVCISIVYGCSVSSSNSLRPGSSAQTSVGAHCIDASTPSQGNTSAELSKSPEIPAPGSELSIKDAELISVNSLSYVGAFLLPPAQDNVSSLNFSNGIIEANDDSLFIVGHNHDDAIAEFTIPELVASTNISELNSAGAPRQKFVKLIDRAASGNPESLDEITGLEVINNSLVINASEFYDAPADNKLSTLIVCNAADLKNSKVSSFRSMKGYNRAAGWISAVPESWQTEIGGTHISGHSSGGPIISRHSVGPSAFAVDLESVVQSNDESQIPTKELLGFSLARPLHHDLFNESGDNKIWTHISRAQYGFIVPGTRTYMTLGWSGGHQSGVGYKVTQTDGNLCGGYCSNNHQDNYNSYWLWDLNEMIKAKNGSVSPYNIRPYEYGKIDLPFQTDDTLKAVGGASYDPVRGLLYISLPRANNELGRNINPPIIVAYKINR